MTKAMKQNKIDGVMLSSLDRRWLLSNVNRMKKIFKQANKEVIIIKSESREQARTEKEHSLDRMATIFIG